MRRLILFIFGLFIGVTSFLFSQSASTGHWSFRTSKLYRLSESGSGYTYSLIRDTETNVIFSENKPTFKRPDATGKYDGKPIGYEMLVKYMWQTPATTLKPGESLCSGLSVEILASSKNPQDASLSYSSRIFFVDVNAKKSVQPYQIPYPGKGDWTKSGTTDVFGPTVGWGGELKNRMNVFGKVPSGSANFKKLGILVRFSSFGYWLYEYDWVAE